MTPFLILISATIFFRAFGAFGNYKLLYLPESLRYAFALTFLFTGTTHFTPMKYDYLNMIPFEQLRNIGMVYFTGVVEILGAIGLLFTKTKKLSAILLVVFLLAVFPANVYAFLNQIPFNDKPPTNLYLRSVMQVIYIVLLLYIAGARSWEQKKLS